MGQSASQPKNEPPVWLGAIDRVEFACIALRIITKYFTQKNYYKINGEPVLMIYFLQNLITGLGGVEKAADALNWFKRQVKKAGLCRFPPVGKAEQGAAVPRWIEIVEQVSRIAYLTAITLLVSRGPIQFQSVWLWFAALFLILYYAVWIRYFVGGREIALLNRVFLFAPVPLAVFPVFYFLCAAVWLHNLPAVKLMTIFGAAHLTVSIQSSCRLLKKFQKSLDR